MRVGSLGCKDPLEKEMASHSSIPAWEIPWTDKPGELQSMCHKRVGHDLATKQLPKYCVKYFQVNCFILLSYFQYSFLPPSLSSPLGISIMCMLISLLMSHRSLSLYSLFFFFSFIILFLFCFTDWIVSVYVQIHEFFLLPAHV